MGCKGEFNSLLLFELLAAPERLRYQSIIRDLLLVSDKNLNSLYSSIIDLMTLKCPTCKTTVDPYPDACSAVMCLNCGNYYCNYCFSGFASGQTDRDRAAAHEHTASHHESDRPEGRDAFLSAEVVAQGHQQYRLHQLVSCLSVAVASSEMSVCRSHDVSLCLILCYQEILDLGTIMIHFA